MSSDAQRFFPPFRLDPANAQLWRGDLEVRLRRKTFEVLLYFVDHPGQLVSKAMLLDAVWPNVSVSDSMPATCVKELRNVLGDGARTPKFIETVHRRGYRFIAPVITLTPESARRQPKASAAPASSAGPTPIIVGRDKELVRLGGWYQDALEGRRRVIFVAGEAGIGKSTFVRTFIDSIASTQSMLVAKGQCIEQYGAGEPYMPVLEALNRLGHQPDGAPLVEILRRFAPSWLAQMPSLIADDDREHLLAATTATTQQRMLREMTLALETLALESVVILLLEDLHWSDFSTLELISAVARHNDPARLLVICTYRPVEMLGNGHPLRTMKEELELHRDCEELRLTLLNQEHITHYLSRRFATEGSEQFRAVVPLIHVRTDGNPLFMVNVVDYLADSGVFSTAAGLSPALRIDPPRNIRQMIERNLARLAPEEQAMLESASVAGPEFSAAVVAAALECSQDEVEACCSRLSRHEQFVTTQGAVSWPDGTIAAAFRFHHSLYQEVLYNRLPIGHRLQLHRRIAIREEAGYGDRVSEVATQLAHHYSLANVKHKALQYFQLAGERAVARGAMVEAEEQYRCALRLLEELPQTNERDHRELELHLAVASALVATKGWAALETEKAYTHARQICDRLGDSPDLLPALFGIYAMYLVRGDVRRARLRALDLIRRAEDTTDTGLKVYAHIALGVTAYFIGDFPTALEHLKLGLSLYDIEQHRALILRYGFDAGVWCLCYLAATLWHLGYPDQALARCDEALALAQKLSNPINVAQARLWTNIIQQFSQAPRAVLENTRGLIALAAGHEITDWQDWAGCLRGWALAAVGRVQDGIALINKSRANLSARGAGIWRPYFLALLAEVCLTAGLIDDGLATASDALNASAQYDELQHVAQIHCLLGEFFAQAGQEKVEKAQAHFERAIAIAHAQSAKSLELQAATCLARLLAQQGARDRARTILTEIFGWFTEGFNNKALREAKALLDQLGDDGRIESSSKSQKF